MIYSVTDNPERAQLGPGKNHHLVINELLDWFVDPLRDGGEFVYVLDIIADQVPLDMSILKTKKIFTGCVYEVAYDMYLTNQALAVKCPVLTGSWEAVVESVMTLSKSYKRQDYGAASDHFSTWIINAIGYPDICPTFSVRFDLMILLLNVVDFNDSNQTQAIR